MNIVKWCLAIFTPAMFKTRNTGTGNGMQRTWGIGGGGGVGRWKGDVIFCVYSQTFLGMSTNSPGNPQTSRVMSPNIPGNIAKHSRECSQTLR